MKIAVLSANLGGFDKQVECVKQFGCVVEEDGHLVTPLIDFHTFTDNDFPPIAGLTPRLQYRIPKCFGWQMFPDYDYYIWYDSSCSLQNPKSVQWFLDYCMGYDMAFFEHPNRDTILSECEYIEKRLEMGCPYITPRYKGGLHREQVNECLDDPDFEDDKLFASTAFVYKNNVRSREALSLWWSYGSRYFTCDQINLPYALFKAKCKVNTIPFAYDKTQYLTFLRNK